jgi:dipeptidyl aminopeptidase/acylaminoacyl peptidase
MRAPLLLIYEPGRALPSQSEALARALERTGKPATVVKVPGGEYWKARSETRGMVLQELEAFLKLHL